MAEANTRVLVGGALEDDLEAFRDAWQRAERGEDVEPQTVIAFESWEKLAALMTGERYRLMRHLHAHPEPSVSALARHVGRHLRRVQADIRALEDAGLVDRSGGIVRATAGRLTATIDF